MSMLMVLMLFVGVVIDVGQVVNRRIALQLVADTGAYTGAAAMATGLNQMAYWNKKLQDAWSIFSFAMTPAFLVHLTGCVVSDPAESLYKVAHFAASTAFKTANIVYASYPYMEAKRVSLYNINDLFPGEGDRFRFAEMNVLPEVGTILPQRDHLKLMNTEEVPEGTRSNGFTPTLIGAKKSLTYMCTAVGVDAQPRHGEYGLWYQRSDDTVKHFVWIVTAPPTKALLFDSLFGGNVIPEMKAAAVAKPVGGSIKGGNSDYITKMELLTKVMSLKGIIDTKYRLKARPVTH
jgi:hypothetical protein